MLLAGTAPGLRCGSAEDDADLDDDAEEDAEELEELEELEEEVLGTVTARASSPCVPRWLGIRAEGDGDSILFLPNTVRQ